MISNTSGPVPARVRQPYYYERLHLGKSHDDLLRCDDCGRLVTYANLTTTGVTKCCGTRRLKQVIHLRFWEWVKIRVGLIRFPYRREFLQEFSRG